MVRSNLVDWQKVTFEDAFTDITAKATKVDQSEFLHFGKYPIVDQGQSFIAGYIDDEELVWGDDLPVVIFGDHTRILKYVDFPFVLGADGTKVLKPKKDILPLFAYYQLLSFDIPSAGYSRHYKFLKDYKFQYPSMYEQKRIASLLAHADRVRRLRRTADNLGDALLQSVFLEMFGDVFRNEKGWERTEIREVAKIIVPTRDKPKRFSGDIPWVTLPDLDGFYVGNAKNLLTKADAAEVGTRLMPANTVLLSCAGSLGKIAITTRPVYTNQQFYGLIANPDVLHYLFLASQLKMFGVEFYFNMAGMSTLGFFSRDKALDIEIILPPLSLQEEFARVVARVESLRGRMGESTRQVEGLFESLLAEAFS